MNEKIKTENLRFICPSLKAGDKILLSGTVYTARDAAHKKIYSALINGEPLPFELRDAIIYYAGPTPARPGMAMGSCGPTTSSRMDKFLPIMMDRGLIATIGKGNRSEEVREAIERNGGVYLCAVGGCGATASACIKKCEVIAYDELGCESVKRLEIEDFPLYIGYDCHGGSIFGIL